MKKNKLSVFVWPCRKSYYLTHPWKWLKSLYWNTRNFFHRGRYGYAYSDVWNWYNWWPMIGAEALRYLANHKVGHPIMPEVFNSQEKWKAHLMEFADKLEWCANTNNIFDRRDERNEFLPMYDEIHKKAHFWSAEEQSIVQRYWERQEKLYEEDQEKCSEIFAEIGRNLAYYWD